MSLPKELTQNLQGYLLYLIINLAYLNLWLDISDDSNFMKLITFSNCVAPNPNPSM